MIQCVTLLGRQNVCHKAGRVVKRNQAFRMTVFHPGLRFTKKKATSVNLAYVASVSVGFRGKNYRVKKERGGGGGRDGRERLQTNPWILKTAHVAFHALLISCCHQAFKSRLKSWITVFLCLIRIIQGYPRCQRFFFCIFMKMLRS